MLELSIGIVLNNRTCDPQGQLAIDMKYGDVTTVGAAIDHLKTIKMN